MFSIVGSFFQDLQSLNRCDLEVGGVGWGVVNGDLANKLYGSGPNGLIIDGILGSD